MIRNIAPLLVLSKKGQKRALYLPADSAKPALHEGWQ